jgi:radical SAM superfamily enzyme YgiQ (UPF0313 family)
MSNCIIINGGTQSHEINVINRTLGAYRLASSLNDSGYSTFVFDFINEFNTNEIKEILDKHIDNETLWVGFSSSFFWSKTDSNVYHRDLKDKMYWTYYDEIEKIIKHTKHNKNVKILYGGSKTPYFMIDENVDYYVLGFADTSILDITDYLAKKKPSIEHCEQIIINEQIRHKVDSFKYPEPKMDNLSTHWWDKKFNILPNESLPMELARGCIFKCKFCNFPLLGKKKGTYLRSADEIKDELIKMYESNGTTTYSITDDTLNDDNDKIEKLHKVFTSLPFKPNFSAYLRIDLLNKYPHQAELLSEMGLMGAFFGIETLQNESAKAIGKGLHPTKVKDRLYWLHEQWKNKVNMSAGFILGLPYDTHEYFYDLLSWSLESDNPLQELLFYPLMMFNHDKKNELKRYMSEFNLNPEIYGYITKNIAQWTLPSQNLDFEICQSISNDYNQLHEKRNKFSAFLMCNMLNIGIPLQHLLKYTQFEILQMYNIKELNDKKINDYKKMLTS